MRKRILSVTSTGRTGEGANRPGGKQANRPEGQQVRGEKCPGGESSTGRRRNV